MLLKPAKALVCSCEGTMRPDADAIAKGCAGLSVVTARNLCGADLDTFKTHARSGDVVVGCTLQQPLFEAISVDENLTASLSFANIRETAGWSREGDRSGPKMAALLAAARLAPPTAPAVTFESEGVTLVLGRDATAIEAAAQISDRLDITVLIVPGADVPVPRQWSFPVRAGRARAATGHLGAFEVTVDGFAEPVASSRGALTYGPARNGAVSKCDVIIDLTGGPALFSAPDLRDGYLRADPGDAAAVQRLLFKATDLSGTFDKPKYITFKPELCAHSRSRITGCTRCLDVCPAGAIAPAGNVVAIDPYICGGCGSCATVCPTGAAGYALPASDAIIGRVRAMMTAWRAAGGTAAPVLLFHDDRNGADLIDALARFGEGLPADVIPIAVNEASQIGPETIAAAFAYGVGALRVLLRGKPTHEPTGLRAAIALMEPVLANLGYGAALTQTIETDDPDGLGSALAAIPRAAPLAKPATFLATGGKRDVLKLALRELHRAAPSAVERITLPAGAPFGRVVVDTAGCTLCLSCVSSCPTHALGDASDKPLLSFDESLCVQCGLCQATCPEKVIALEPRLDFAAFEAGAQVVKQEEPFCCTTCGKPFGVKSTIDRIRTKLEASHWMFQGSAGGSRLALIGMCDDCRVTAVTNEGLDPYAAAERPRPKTSEDYFRLREAERAKKSENDA